MIPKNSALLKKNFVKRFQGVPVTFLSLNNFDIDDQMLSQSKTTVNIDGCFSKECSLEVSFHDTQFFYTFKTAHS